MKDQAIRRSLRGAIYTRVSTEQGLEQDFNSLDAQREACEAYIKSQAHEGWRLVRMSETVRRRVLKFGPLFARGPCHIVRSRSW